MTWEVIIPGPPVPKARARRAPDGHWYTPKRTQEYEQSVGWAAKAAGLRLEPGRIYGLGITFYVTRLSRDADNLTKSVMDGLFPRQKGAADDRQVVSLSVQQRFCEAGEERTVVIVEDRGEQYAWMKGEAGDSEGEGGKAGSGARADTPRARAGAARSGQARRAGARRPSPRR